MGSTLAASVFGFQIFGKPEALVLSDIQTIIVEEKIESRKFSQAVADFNALWAYRVGHLLSVESIKLSNESSIILRQSNRLKSKKPGSFQIKQRGSNIIVKSYDEKGWINALYTIAHELLGARWYWPTPLGFEWVGDVPETWELASTTIEPSFSMRSLYGSDTEYSLRNRLSGGYSFNHNLARIFKPEYQSIAPNIFADLGDRSITAKGHAAYDPQPNFTDSDAVHLVALTVIDYFNNNPEAKSFSLSPNDNVLYDTTEATEQMVSPLSYFRGRPNYTDLTFSFANKVAERVFDQEGLWKTDRGEDRYLSMLAYYWTEQSPSIPLHPRILPVLTSDRAQWHDPVYRTEDKALINRWNKTDVKKLGAWDYYFGAPYPYPRQFTQWISESIPYLKENRIDIFFSQLPSMWGLDGPKAWLATQLLWNVESDSEILLNEFYEEFFGEASGAMRSFYEMAEIHRNTYEGKANWIKYYLDESGIELFPKLVLEQMRLKIEEAKTLVDPGTRFSKRIEVVSEAFELTELYEAYHSARVDLVHYSLGNITSGGIEFLKVFKDRRNQFEERVAQLKENPMHKHFKYFLKMKQTNPIPCSLISIVKEDTFFDEAFMDRYERELSLAYDWIHFPELFKTRIGNPSLTASFRAAKARDFLGPKIPKMNYWRMDFRAAEGFSIDPISKDGSMTQGLRIRNADMFNLYTLALLSKQREYILTAKIKFQISPDCRAQLRLDWLDEEGTKFEKLRIIQLPNGCSESYTQLEIPLIAPEQAIKAKISFLLQRQGEGDFIDIQEINFLRGPKE